MNFEISNFDEFEDLTESEIGISSISSFATLNRVGNAGELNAALCESSMAQRPVPKQRYQKRKVADIDESLSNVSSLDAEIVKRNIRLSTAKSKCSLLAPLHKPNNCGDFTNDLNSVIELNSQLTSKIASKEKEIQQLRKNLDIYDQQSRESLNERFRYQTDYLSWEQFKVQQTEFISKTLLAKEELEMKNKNKKQELDSCHELILSLKKEHETKDLEISALLDKLEKGQSEIRISKSKTFELVKALTTQMSLREESLLEALQNLQDEGNSFTDDLKKQLESTRNELLNLHEKDRLNEEINAQNIELKEKLNLFQDKFDSSTKMHSAEISTLKTEYSELKLNNGELVIAKEEVERQIQEIKTDKSKLEEEIKKLNKEVLHHKSALKGSEKLYSELQINHNITIESLNQVNRTCEAFQNRIADVTERLDFSEKEIACTTEQIENIKRENVELHEYLKMYKEDLNHSIKEINYLKEHCALVEAEKTSSGETTSTLHAKLEEMRNKIIEISNANDSLHHALVEQLQLSEIFQDNLLISLDSVGISKETIICTFEQERKNKKRSSSKRNISQIKQSESVKVNVSRGLELLVGEILNVRQNCSELQDRVNKLESHVTGQSTNASNLSHDVMKLDSYLKKAKKENKELLNELLAIKQKQTAHFVQLTNALDQNAVACDKIKKQENLLLTAESVVREERARYRVYQKSLQESQSKCTQLQTSFDEAKAIIEELNNRHKKLSSQVERGKHELKKNETERIKLLELNAAYKRKCWETEHDQSALGSKQNKFMKGLFETNVSSISAQTHTNVGKCLHEALQLYENRNVHGFKDISSILEAIGDNSRLHAARNAQTNQTVSEIGDHNEKLLDASTNATK